MAYEALPPPPPRRRAGRGLPCNGPISALVMMSGALKNIRGRVSVKRHCVLLRYSASSDIPHPPRPRRLPRAAEGHHRSDVQSASTKPRIRRCLPAVCCPCPPRPPSPGPFLPASLRDRALRTSARPPRPPCSAGGASSGPWMGIACSGWWTWGTPRARGTGSWQAWPPPPPHPLPSSAHTIYRRTLPRVLLNNSASPAGVGGLTLPPPHPRQVIGPSFLRAFGQSKIFSGSFSASQFRPKNFFALSAPLTTQGLLRGGGPPTAPLPPLWTPPPFPAFSKLCPFSARCVLQTQHQTDETKQLCGRKGGKT